MTISDDLVRVGSFFVYTGDSPEGLPRTVEIGSQAWVRFMDRIYCPGSPFELGVSDVIELCELRMARRGELVDEAFHSGVVMLLVEVCFRWAPRVRSWLDFGCGDGDVAQLVAEVAPHIGVTGLDMSRRSLERARQRMPETPLLLAGAPHIPLRSGSCEVVTAAFVFHFREAWSALKEVTRSLCPGGVLVATHYGPTLEDLIERIRDAGLVLVDRIDVGRDSGHQVIVAQRVGDGAGTVSDAVPDARAQEAADPKRRSSTSRR